MIVPMLHRRPALALALALPALLLPRRPHAEGALLRGPVRPRFVAQIGPVIDGVVRDLMVREGDAVTAGQVLLGLVDDVQMARIGLARASSEADGELRQAQVQADEAAAVVTRTQSAAAARAATEWEVRQARARLDAARAAVEAQQDRRRIEQRRLGLEEALLDQHRVRAPFDGQVTRVDTTIGATLTRTDRPLTVADLSALEAVIFLPAEFWARLRPGAQVPLRLAAPLDRQVMARMRHADPVMDAASARFRAVFEFVNPGLLVPAGIEAGFDPGAMP